MAHRVLGIDLGSYSVKVAEFASGFRQTQLVGLYELPLLEPLEGEEATQHRAVRTLRAFLDRAGIEAEVAATAIGNDLTMRLLHLPFSDKKTLDQVLPAEFESLILGDIGEMVIDAVVGDTDDRGTGVLAVAAPQARLQQIIDELSAVRCDPRVIVASPLAGGSLADLAFDRGTPTAVVDIGHKQTHVCATVGGKVIYARTLRRGGEEVTRALGGAFRMNPGDADSAKHEQAFVLPDGVEPESMQHRRVDEVVKEALRPLVRELRQTLSAITSDTKIEIERVFLTGGGSRLRGLVEYLRGELQLPTAFLTLPQDSDLVGKSIVAGETLFAQQFPLVAFSAGLAAATAVPQVNLRKGGLAYRTDYSYLRQKALPLAIGVACILLSAGLNAYAGLRGLREESAALEKRLETETKELFGESKLDGKSVSEELRQGPRGGLPPIPPATALDIMEMITKAVPPADQVRLDILELDIKSKKVYLKATAESAAQIDKLAEALGKVDCFTDVQKGKVASVPLPAGQAPPAIPKPPTSPALPGTTPADKDKDGKDKDKTPDAPTELKQFTFTIETKCN